VADTKISGLTAIVGTDVDTAADVFPIVDTSVTTTKKILVDELRIALGIATQAQQETGTSLVTTVTPGRQQFHPSAAKFWCRFNSAGTDAASYNVASITDTGVGDWTVVIATDFSSGNWCITAVGGQVTAGTLTLAYMITGMAGGTVNVIARNTSTFTSTDPTGLDAIFVSGFGDQ